MPRFEERYVRRQRPVRNLVLRRQNVVGPANVPRPAGTLAFRRESCSCDPLSSIFQWSDFLGEWMNTPDFFRSRLDQMIDLHHLLAVLSARLPWASIELAAASKLAHQPKPAKRVIGEDLAGAFEREFGGGIRPAGRPRRPIRVSASRLCGLRGPFVTPSRRCSRASPACCKSCGADKTGEAGPIASAQTVIPSPVAVTCRAQTDSAGPTNCRTTGADDLPVSAAPCARLAAAKAVADHRRGGPAPARSGHSFGPRRPAPDPTLLGPDPGSVPPQRR